MIIHLIKAATEATALNMGGSRVRMTIFLDVRPATGTEYGPMLHAYYPHDDRFFSVVEHLRPRAEPRMKVGGRIWQPSDRGADL